MMPELRQPAEDADDRAWAVVEALGLGRWEADASMVRVSRVTPGVERLLGFPAQRWTEELGLWLARVHPLDKPEVLRQRATHEDHVAEYRFLAADGRVLWLRESVTFRRDPQGVVRGVIGVVQDVSAQRRDAARLAAQTGLASALASARSLDEAGETLLAVVADALNYELAAIWRVGPDGLLRAGSAWVADHIAAASFRTRTRALGLAPGQGLPGRVLQTGRPAWIADVARDSNFLRLEEAAREGIHAGVAVPIRRGDTTYGVLELFTREVRAPDEALLSILESIGAQLGQFEERRLAEAHARDLGIRRGAILETALDAVITIDAEGRVVEWNPAAERTFRYTRDEAIGRPMSDLIVPPEHREAHRAGLARQVRTGEARVLGQRLELPAVRKDGTRFPAEIAIVRIPVEGAPLFTGHIRDISARKSAEHALRESEERYRFLADAVPQHVWTARAGGTLDYANRRAVAYFGADPVETGWDALVHAEDVARLREAWASARTSGEAFEVEVRLRRHDGQHRWHIVRAEPQKTPEGAIDRWFGSSMDVEEKKRQQERLATLLREVELQRKRLDNIVASVPGVVWEAWGEPDAAAQRIDFVSEHVVEMLGYTTQEWLSTPNFWLTIVHPDDQAEAARLSRAAYASGKGNTFEFRWRRKDGTYLWVQAWNVIIKDELGRPAGMRGVTLDISKRKEAEIATRVAEDRFRLLARATSDTIWDWDLATNVLWWNENFTTMFGYPPSEIEASIDSWTSRIHPEDLTRVKSGVLAAIARGDATWQDEYRFQRKDGAYTDVFDRGFIIRDGAGKGVRMVGSMMDVTDRKRAEAELRRVTRNLEQILQSAGEGIYGVDHEGVTTFMNDAALAACGLTRDEAVGHKLHGVIHHTHTDGSPYPATECPIYQAAHGGPGGSCTDDVFWRKDGTSFPVEYVTAPIRDGDRVVGAVTVFNDVSERRRTEAALRESEARYRLLAENTKDLITRSDIEGRISYATAACRELLGYEPEEMVGCLARDLLHPDDSPLIEPARAKLRTATEPQVITGRFRRKDGSYVWVEAIARPVADASGAVRELVASWRDITERKAAEEALRQSEERFRSLSAASPVGIFMADREGRATYTNQSCRTICGFGEQEALGVGWTSFIHPDDRSRVGAEWYAYATSGHEYSSEFRWQRPDGSVRWTHVRAAPVVNDRGVHVGHVGTVEDITDRRLAEQAVRESRERLDLALQAASLGAWDLDLRTDTAVRSLRHDQIFGYERGVSEWGATRFFSHVVPEDRDAVRAAFDQAFREGRLHFECRIARADGVLAWISVQGAVVYEAGQPVRMLGVVSDITERVQSKLRLDESSARMSAILESINDAFFALDHSWRFTYVNSQAEKVLGRKKEDLLGRVIWEEYPGLAGSEFEKAYLRAMDDRIAGHVEDFYPDHGAWYEVKIYPSSDGLSVYFQNVSDRKSHEREIREGRERLDVALAAAELGAWDLDLRTQTSIRSLRHDQIFGYPNGVEDWGAPRFLEHVLPEHRAAVQAAFEAAAQSGRLGFECQIRRADGALAWISVQGVVTYERGAPARMLGVVADVTERRRAEDAIRESEARYRFLAENARDMITRSAPDGRMLYVSPAVRRLLGYEPEELVGRVSMELVHPEDVERVRRERAEISAQDDARVVTLRFRRKDGAWVWLEAIGQAVHDPKSGAVVELVAASRDITERKRAEQELRRQGALLTWQRAVLEAIVAGAPLQQALATLCQEAHAQAPERAYSVLLLSDDGKRLRHGGAAGLPDHYNAAIDGLAIGADVGSCGSAAATRQSVVVKDIATDPKWAAFTPLALPIGLRACWSTPIFGSNGALLGTWAVYGRETGGPTKADDEITTVATRLAAIAIERARAEEELRYQTELFRTVTENTGSALFMMDERGHPVFLNSAAREMTGYASIDEIKERPLHYAVHFRKPDGSDYPMEECPIDRANAEIRPVRNQRETFTRKDGTLFPVEYNVAPVERAGDRRGAVLEVRDITEPLRAEAELRQRAEELAKLTDALTRSNKELDQFAYITSHDLKAPLRGIANLSRWIEEDIGERITSESKGHLDLLRGRVQRMESLIDAILEYSRAGRVKARPEQVEVGKLLSEVVDLLAPPPGFVVDVEDPMPTLVTERMRLQQVFMNLIGNAIKHHHRKAEGRIAISAEDAGDMWRFRVSDNGPGIAPRFHEKIFVIFQTLEARDKVEGTGIGLSLVKKIVESFGGTITVDSDVGRGATFEFTWPKQ